MPPTGNLTFKDHGRDISLKATSFTMLNISGNHALISGYATVNGEAGVAFTLNLEDMGEPGSSDTFLIQIPALNGYSAGGTVTMEHLEPNIVVKVRSGSSAKIVSPRDGTSRMMRWMPHSDKVIFVNGSSARPEEVFISAGSLKRLTRFQTVPLRRSLQIAPKVVRFTSFDKRKVQALLYVPRNTSRRAGVVLPHGGPEMFDSNTWDQLTTMMLDKGFCVIKPNYRGSTGFGRKFLHLHDGDLGGGDYLDTVYAGKYLTDRGLVDKDRLGYWGASYSGSAVQ